MGLNKENQLKFDVGTTDSLTVESAGMVESDFGSEYVVMIKTTIDGYTHFKPSPGLEKKIKEENVDKGDVITIEKAPKSDKYPYGYFSITVVEKNAQGNKEEMDKYATGEIKAVEPVDKGMENFEKQFKSPNQNLELHELKMRMENLEGEVHLLKKKVEDKLKPTMPF